MSSKQAETQISDTYVDLKHEIDDDYKQHFTDSFNNVFASDSELYVLSVNKTPFSYSVTETDAKSSMWSAATNFITQNNTTDTDMFISKNTDREISIVKRNSNFITSYDQTLITLQVDSIYEATPESESQSELLLNNDKTS
ncbi:MAG: hypothetical protein ACW98X_13250 [Promethearchaeota archaeon]|jgi:hypothetical protein